MSIQIGFHLRCFFILAVHRKKKKETKINIFVHKLRYDYTDLLKDRVSR